jgi:hypothetical protein
MWIWHWRCCRRHSCMPGDHTPTCDLYNIHEFWHTQWLSHEWSQQNSFEKYTYYFVTFIHMYQLQNHYTDFHHIWYMGILLNFLLCTVRFWLKWDNSNSLYKDLHAFLHISSLAHYIYTYITHSWSQALLEMPPFLQLLKNFPAFYGTWRFIIMLTRALR